MHTYPLEPNTQGVNHARCQSVWRKNSSRSRVAGQSQQARKSDQGTSSVADYVCLVHMLAHELRPMDTPNLDGSREMLR